MQSIIEIDLATLRSHEQAVHANVTVGSYHMDRVSPTHEFRIFRGTLEPVDWLRLYMIGEFAKHTWGDTARVVDVDVAMLPENTRERVESFIQPTSTEQSSMDLRQHPELAPVLVTSDIESRSLVVIDGNHRAIAQCWEFGPVADVPIIICVHQHIARWPFVPRHARDR